METFLFGGSVKVYSGGKSDLLRIFTPKGGVLIRALYPEALKKINDFRTQWGELEEAAFIEAVLEVLSEDGPRPSAVASSVNRLHLKNFPLAAQAITCLVASLEYGD